MNIEKVDLIGTSLLVTSAAIISAEPERNVSVLDDFRLTALCVIGSWIGAFLAVAIFPNKGEVVPVAPDPTRTRIVAVKYLASMLGGVCFTPMIMEYSGIVITSGKVLGISGIVATVAWSSIHGIAPLFSRAAVARAKAALGEHDKTE